MTIEFARNVLGMTDANSTEFDATTEHPVIGPDAAAARHQRQGRDDAALGGLLRDPA